MRIVMTVALAGHAPCNSRDSFSRSGMRERLIAPYPSLFDPSYPDMGLG